MPIDNVLSTKARGHNKTVEMLKVYCEKFPEQAGNVKISDVIYESEDLVTVKLRIKLQGE